MCCAGVRPNIASEASRIGTRVMALMEDTTPGAPCFRTERAKAYILVSLQDRVSQVGKFVESFQSALALVYRMMFPLNP
jgi:hypothetical protein